MRTLALFSCVPLLAQTAIVDPAQALIQETKTALEARIQAYRAHVAAGKPRSEFKWNFEKELARINVQLAQPQPEAMKHALLVSELGYRVVGHEKVAPAAFESTRAAVPATSPAWGIEPSLFTELAENLSDEKAVTAYLSEARVHSPVAEVRSYLLEQQFEDALDAKDVTTWKAALATLEKEHAGSKDLASARKSLEQYQKTAVGVAAPAFKVASLEQPGTEFTLETFKGKFVLIDFWATWCPYCRLELPFMHKAWERFSGKNFEILSFSFDQKAADIAPFRKKPGTPMPWKHAFVEGAKKSTLADAYGVVGIPKAILVGPDGKIVATDAELKGKQLEVTLEKFLGK